MAGLGSSLEPSEGAGPSQQFDFRLLASRTVREKMWSAPSVWEFVRQPQETVGVGGEFKESQGSGYIAAKTFPRGEQYLHTGDARQQHLA